MGHDQANAPQVLFLIPDEKNERKCGREIGKIPGALSMLAFNGDSKAVVKGLKDFPAEDRPPVC